MADQARTGGLLSWIKGNFDWMAVFFGSRLMQKSGTDNDPLKSADDEHAIVASFAGLRDGSSLGEAKFKVATAFYNYLKKSHKLTIAVRLRQLLSRAKDKDQHFSPEKATTLLANLLGLENELTTGGNESAVTASDPEQQLRNILDNPEELDAMFGQLTDTLEIALKNPAMAALSDRWDQLTGWNRKADEEGAAAVRRLRRNH